jgi:hypothetical protein
MFRVARKAEERAQLEIQDENGSKYAKIALMPNGLKKIKEFFKHYILKIVTLGWYDSNQFKPNEYQIKKELL